MDRLGAMFEGEYRDDAERFSDADFAAVHGASVANRVRRRRRSRAAGSAGLGIALVLGAGAVAYPSVERAASPAVAPACVPVPEDVDDWWDRGIADGNILSSVGGAVNVKLSEELLTVIGSGEDAVEIPIRDHLLDGTSATGEPVEVALPSGTIVGVSLTWTADAISLRYGLVGSDSWATASVGPGASTVGDGRDLTDPGTRYLPHLVPDASDEGVVYDIRDAATALDALTVTWTDDRQVEVEFPDGTVESFDAGDDAWVTFTWVGVATFQVSVDPTWGTSHVGDAAFAPVDAEVVGPQWCAPAWLTPSPRATSPAPVASSPS